MEAPRRGRPRVWSDPRARQQAHQQRQRAKLRLLADLLHAVRNAQWDDRQLHRRIQEGDDAAVLQALIEHYQARHWCRVQHAGDQPSAAGAKGGDAKEKL